MDGVHNGRRDLRHWYADATVRPLNIFRFSFQLHRADNARTVEALRKSKFSGLRIEIDLDQIAKYNLFAGYQVRQRRNQQALNRALQMPCAVSAVQAFPQQDALGPLRTLEYKLGSRKIHDSLLHCIEFKVKDLSQMTFLQRAKDHHLVDAVHEFRRKLAPCSFDGGTANLLVDIHLSV